MRVVEGNVVISHNIKPGLYIRGESKGFEIRKEIKGGIKNQGHSRVGLLRP